MRASLGELSLGRILGHPEPFQGFVGRGTHPHPVNKIQLHGYSLGLGIFFPLLSSQQRFCDWFLVPSPFCHRAEGKRRGRGRKELPPPRTDRTAQNKYQSRLVASANVDGKEHMTEIRERNNARRSAALPGKAGREESQR